MDLGGMLKKLDITDTIDGTLDLKINLRGEGNSVAALMAVLNGDVVAILGEGKMPARYLNLVGGDLGKTLGSCWGRGCGEKLIRSVHSTAVHVLVPEKK